MRYKVEQYELHLATYYVDAKDRVEAIEKVANGAGSRDDVEFMELATDFGIPTEGGFSDKEFNELNELGLIGEADQVCGIHSVERES